MTEKQIMLDQVSEPCEACGATAEIGYIIREDDVQALVTINATNKKQLLLAFEKYEELAKSVNSNVRYQLPELADEATQLIVSLTFECSAEKLIFELKSRGLNQ